MSRNRFVTPDTVRLEISDGDWVEIKAQLGVAEQKRLESAGVAGVKGTPITEGAAAGSMEDAEATIDWSRFYMSKLETYLVDWSFQDGNNKHVKCTKQAIAQLDADTADEIVTVINDYLDRVEAAKRADPPTTSASNRRSA